MLDWYVMHSKPQKEQWLLRQLHARNIEAYYPCLQRKAGKLDSRIIKPYFPGYLFVNVDLERTGTSMLEWIPGSLGLISLGGEPARVPEGLLQKIRRHVDEINSAQARMVEGLQPGDEVVICSGPFAGYDAIFCARLRDTERVQVLLKALQDQRMKIDLQADQIRTPRQNKKPL
jgi:transcription antitermination factor NusG